MELDDLKKNWQQSGDKIKPPQKDTLELIKSRGEQPLAKLKRRFRKGMLLMPVIGSIVVVEFSHKKDFASHFLLWYMVGFCAAMLLYFFINYRLVSKMQLNEGDVRANLVLQTKTLTQLLQARLLLMRGALALFFVMLEILMYVRSGDGYDSWKAHSVFYRLLVYTLIFVFFFFFTRLVINHRYRKNIDHLQALVKELEEV